MRLTAKKPRILTTAAIALLASTLTVGVASADSSAPARSTASRTSAGTSHVPSSLTSLIESVRGSKRGCVVMTGLTEQFIEGTVTGAGPDPTKPQIGQHGVYSMRVYNAAGEVIGEQRDGTTDVYAQAPNGHFLVHGVEDFKLNDGSIHAEGNYDLTSTLAHEWQVVPAVGTSGRYKGKRGYEFFYDVTNPFLFKLAFVLCG
ncbi:allene oxide cyclase barrel-like domain-containing protein [Streptomyces sp. ACT015]|uniref:allene oxide cyclase barrel-like domain-containing protein n=1 Tax=Streptomyces sp. ACT015 TaxID=3134807 RepID=UPI003D17468C